jgi:hypothetical protein
MLEVGLNALALAQTRMHVPSESRYLFIALHHQHNATCVAHLPLSVMKHPPNIYISYGHVGGCATTPAALPSRHHWLALLTLEVQPCILCPTKAEPELSDCYNFPRLNLPSAPQGYPHGDRCKYHSSPTTVR